jgi:hypothetical protein
VVVAGDGQWVPTAAVGGCGGWLAGHFQWGLVHMTWAALGLACGRQNNLDEAPAGVCSLVHGACCGGIHVGANARGLVVADFRPVCCSAFQTTITVFIPQPGGWLAATKPCKAAVGSDCCMFVKAQPDLQCVGRGAGWSLAHLWNLQNFLN